MTKKVFHMTCSECGDYTIGTASTEPIIYCPFCGSETGAITDDDDDDWDDNFFEQDETERILNDLDDDE